MSRYVRTVKTASGATVVQVVYSSHWGRWISSTSGRRITSRVKEGGS